MFFKYLLMYLHGYVDIIIEGFFIERFINQCKSKKIILQDLYIQNNSLIKARVLQSDFKELRHIAKNTKCKIKIDKKVGAPFIIHRYRKRKIYAIAGLVIAFFIFVITCFIWNVDIEGNEKISEDEIRDMISEYGISVGTYKFNIDSEKIINSIRLKRDDIAWIGIEINGTNAIISIKETTATPEVIDESEICDIVANEDAIISKIIVQNGTARVEIGDEVKKGDLLVEGIMEGKYTGVRQVHAEASVYGKIFFEKEKSESYVQYIRKETGNIENKNQIILNKFKINLYKGVSKFENYDKISSSKKIRFFSNLYLPIEVKTTKFIEIENEKKEYTSEELIEKIKSELEVKMESEFEISNFDEDSIEEKVEVDTKEEGITLKLIYEIQKEIGVKAVK